MEISIFHARWLLLLNFIVIPAGCCRESPSLTLFKSGEAPRLQHSGMTHGVCIGDDTFSQNLFRKGLLNN